MHKRISGEQEIAFLRIDGGPKLFFFSCEWVAVQILIAEKFEVEPH